jgi:uncharacterized membrane protein YeaQ/YmgE (transglycosylase-associated protein family)
MTGHDLLWYAIVGLVTGWLSGVLVQGHGMGIVRDIAVGVVGALIGGFLAGELDIRVGGFFGALGMSVIGAVLFLVVLRALMPSRRGGSA